MLRCGGGRRSFGGRALVISSGNGDPWDALIAAGMKVGAWDFGDATTLFQDTAGTTPVASGGDPIARANDLTGSGLHLLQSSGTRRPTWQPDGLLAAALFDGVDDVLAAAAQAFGVQKITILVGYRVLTGAAALVGVMQFMEEAGNGLAFIPFSTFSLFQAFAGHADDATFPTGYTVEQKVVISATFDSTVGAAASLVVKKNDVAQTMTHSLDVDPTTFGPMVIRLGANNDTFFPFKGDIFAAMAIGGLPTADQLAACATWINERTGGY